MRLHPGRFFLVNDPVLHGGLGQAAALGLNADEGQGLVARQVFAEVPPRVEYTLSELGDTLRPVIDVLYDWGIRYEGLTGTKNR